MKNIKKLIALLCALSFLFCFAGCGDKDESGNPADSKPSVSSGETASGDNAEGIGTHHAVITVKGLGDIKLELYGDIAPVTVQNFMDLANAKFYDGLTFHRIIKDFMVQGGDPKADGTGSSEKEIKGEFSNNGVNNTISHKRGVISMARAGNPYNDAPYYNTASSQFFIVHKDSLFLDGNYASFGMVTEGMEIVDSLAENTPVTDDNGTVLKENQPVIESVKIID